MRAIFADNLQKKFGEKMVLDGVSLDVSEGEIFGLLGPSGVGDHLKKGQIRSIHSTEPSLEMVFIELTGKGLGV